MDYDRLNTRFVRVCATIDSAIKNQEKNEKLKIKCDNLEKYIEELGLILRECRIINDLCIKEEYSFRTGRIKYLELFVSEELGTIFEEEGFTVSVVDTVERNKLSIRLVLHDQNGKVRLPSINEGKLCQELISFACAVGIIRAAGLNKLYIDEAFAASSEANLEKLSNNLERVVSDGIQVICIEQFPYLYSNIKRREFHISKNRFSGISSITDIVDFE
jgi:DNA repair exonuclease SbcCD ATPase subunit